MGRTEGRTSHDTKHLILDAAARVLRRDGLTASLDDIAAEAKVTKGGLIYHYHSKQALLLALGHRLARSFAAEVEEALADDDDQRGRYTRAYIHASIGHSTDPNEMKDIVVLAANLVSCTELHALAAADAEHWRRVLLSDGLPARTITLIIAATDGIRSGPLWGSALGPPEIAELRNTLLDLTGVSD